MGDDVRDRWLGKYLEQQSRGGRLTEQPESRDDWDTIVQYNEKILEQYKLTAATHDQNRKATKIVPGRNDTMGHQPGVAWRIERSNYEPPKPPSATQQTSRRLLPVLEFLNRQVKVSSSLFNI